MGLNISEWIVLLCFCVFGIEKSYQFMAEMREINQKCMMDGGFCINIIPPPPPRQRQQRRRQQQRQRVRTATRRGQRNRRPSPADVGASHTRLPASALAAQAASPNMGYPAPAQVPPVNAAPGFTPIGQLGGAGAMGAGNQGMSPAANPFGDFGLGFMMFSRKKRQAADPEAAAETPRIRRGQSTYDFLNLHCRKTDFDFGCRQTGGICCLPPL